MYDDPESIIDRIVIKHIVADGIFKLLDDSHDKLVVRRRHLITIVIK